MKSVPRKSSVRQLRSVPKPRGKRVMNPGEWAARVELAAAYRLTAMMGWDDMLGTHISCRVPGTTVLRNHGTLTVGASVGEMFARMYRLERACKFQITAMTGGAELNPLPQEIVDRTLQQGKHIYSGNGRGAGGTLMWAALLRRLARTDPRYDC